MDRDNVAWFAPIGETCSRYGNNLGRWSGAKADAYSAIVDQIGSMQLGDPAILPLFLEAMTHLV